MAKQIQLASLKAGLQGIKNMKLDEERVRANSKTPTIPIVSKPEIETP